MSETTSSATSAAVFTSDNVHGAIDRGRLSRRSASSGTQGVDPIAPAASASHSSGVRYQPTVYAVGAATVVPAIARRKAIAFASVSARKNTQPIITTSIV